MKMVNGGIMKYKMNLYTIFVVLVVLSIPAMAYFSGVMGKENGDFLFEKAAVKQIVEEDLTKDEIIEGIHLGVQQIEVEILTGPLKGERYFIKNSMSRLYNVEVNQDDTIIVRVVRENDEVINVMVFNYHRAPILIGLGLLFLLLLIVIGGVKGARSALSLFFAGSVLVFFMLPMLFKGYNPITLSIVSVSIITVVSLILVSHWNYKTLSAIMGTVTGVLIAGLLSYFAGQLTHLSGITMDEAEELIFMAGDKGIQIKGLMFAAILIASLGAVMDVAMSIASSIFEIKNQNKALQLKELFVSGMNVGRDVMGTMANTLILAFAGGALNVMILIFAYEMPINQLLNLDFVGTELILGLSGSIGIVLTVPVTALAASFLSGYGVNKYVEESK